MKNKHKALLALALAATMMSGAEAKSCRLTFSGYEGAETLKDFPALIKIPDGLTGFNYADSSADGSGLAFFGVDGQPLACEIDTWDPEGDSYVWVRVPELTKSTTITARWGESCAETFTSSPCSAWNDDYLAVWHFSKFRKGVTRGYGWAIWDYDGPFGFVDSGRPDAEYIEIDGRKIDRKILELLRAK